MFFWSRSLVLLNKSRILLNKIEFSFCTPTFQARLAPMYMLLSRYLVMKSLAPRQKISSLIFTFCESHCKHNRHLALLSNSKDRYALLCVFKNDHQHTIYNLATIKRLITFKFFSLASSSFSKNHFVGKLLKVSSFVKVV